MAAPVCHIPPPTTEAENPTQGPGTTNRIAAIPPAQPTIASLMMTVNKLREVVNTITKDPGIQNNFRTDNNNKRVQWVELSRQVEKVKIYQNNDTTSDNWVEVEQINRLVMQDKNTGQTWEWKRKR